MKKLLIIFLNILFVSVYSQDLTLTSVNAIPAQTQTMFGKYKLYVFADDSAKDNSGDLKIDNTTNKFWDYELFYFKENNYTQIPDVSGGVIPSKLATGYYILEAKEQGNPSVKKTVAVYVLNVAKAKIAGIEQVARYKKDCDSMKLVCSLSKQFGKTIIKDYTDTTQHYTFNYALTYNWSSKTIDGTQTYTPNKNELMITGALIPREHASFIASITDGVNKPTVDSIPVATIHVNPKYEIFDTTSTMYDRTYKDGDPMVIKLRNISSTKANWKKFEWQFFAKDVLLEKISKNLEQTNEDNAYENFVVTIKRAGENKIKLIATSQDGCIDSAEVLKKTIGDLKYTIPNAFIPEDSDIKKAIFKIINPAGIISFDGRIFNRWGQEVYRWSNPDDGWDGTINGRDASAGTYYYRFIIVGTTTREDKTGPLLLIR